MYGRFKTYGSEVYDNSTKTEKEKWKVLITGKVI